MNFKEQLKHEYKQAIEQQEKIDKIINEYVPSGMNVHENQRYKFLELEQLYCYKLLKNMLTLENRI